MNEIFFTADLHLGHTNIIKFEHSLRPFSSIEEHNETLIDNWNRTVHSKDTIWVLGDIVFGQDNLVLLERLKGYKKLILGNHDSMQISRYMEYFSQIKGSLRFKEIFILTHIPIVNDYLDRYKVNLHGHVHRLDWKATEDGGLKYINVGVTHNNLKPISFEEIKRMI